MSVVDKPTARTVTAADLMTMPDDGVERDLIRGELRERPMTKRDRDHSLIEATLGGLLFQWLQALPEPRGRIASGEAGVRLRNEPETFVGVDIAYLSQEQVANTARGTPFFDGPPILAVEILSPSDRQGDVAEKVRLYLDCGCVVWVVDPHFRTVSVHRPGSPVETFNERQELSGDPELPGFRVPVAKVFA